ncbi:ABC transporter [Hahella sp. CCB-MM4]|uniref:ABC transporter ATP-binding protein n=1 Tax=Hahella sp. (strain CCB-MM4) TaxID=1926491 RepID=UPI000B9B3A9C|nr:ABC transporter ATP-binding protein [Hahella sp. CCB-MM4]OZG70257.1 ABC transporter [Hahella sp. CCB-MM4]
MKNRLELLGITKRYPGCIANQSIKLSVGEGEIHALLGENGAGKSTLMKIIYGVVKADEGEMIWEGHQVDIQGPSHARQLGIGMVFQHFSLFETLTVAENIALSLPKEKTGSLNELKQKIVDVSQRYGMKLDPDRYVHTLSIGEQQRVEIVRCLLQDLKLLILDEPTSVLTPQEVNKLFETLQQLSAEGCSILFISHKLDEVRALCHNATILRAGKVSGDCDPQQTTTEEIARLMVGDDTPFDKQFTKVEGSTPCLEVNRLTFKSEDPFSTPIRDISFTVRSGEILGIAGVAGNGQEELLRLISGEEQCKSEAVVLNSKPIGKLHPDQRRKLGIGVVPEERLGRGAVPNHSLAQNTLLTGFLSGLSRFGWIHYHKVRELADKIISEFKVKSDGAGAQAKSLSGGNLQKFIIGREILQHPYLLVCSHPTWGVDVGAALVIHEALIRLRDQGGAILVLSEDIEELYKICDRIGAICDGRLSPIHPTDQVSIELLGQWMTGEFDSSSSPAEMQETSYA